MKLYLDTGGSRVVDTLVGVVAGTAFLFTTMASPARPASDDWPRGTPAIVADDWPKPSAAPGV